MNVKEGNRKEEAARNGTVTVLTLPVEGMTCASCVARVEKTLKRMDGVENASVNLATEKATVRFDSARVSLDSLKDAVADAGYTLRVPADGTSGRAEDPATGDPTRDKPLRDLLVSIALTIPVMILGMLSMTDWYAANIPLSHSDTATLELLLTTPILFGPGRRFFKGFLVALKHATADMNTLVAVGTGAAYLYSAVATLFPHWLGMSHAGDVYFDTAATILTLILFGKFLEANAKRRASSAIRQLASLQPRAARVLRNDIPVDIPVEQIIPGDALLIRPGEAIPVDGDVLTGSTAVNEALITGESMPVEKKPGDAVIGGTVNTTGSITMRASAVGADTVLAHIIRLVEDAQATKAPVQALADKVAAVFVPVVVSIAILTFIGWQIFGHAGFTVSMMNFIAVLIIACPCALGLATPTAIMVGTGAAARRGILIRNIESLERARDVTTVLFDKTGTLTEGNPRVTEILPFGSTDRTQLMQVTASLEQASEHPLAKAIVAEARLANVPLSNPSEVQAAPGGGIQGVVDGMAILAGSPAFVGANGVAGDVKSRLWESLLDAGDTVLLVAIDGRLAGAFGIADRLKDGAAKAVARLTREGVTVAMISGDNQKTAAAIGRTAGIASVFAEVAPGEKAAKVRALQTEGAVVAMVGDGINDAPALAQADVGIAMGKGTAIAAEASDITLMRDDLEGVLDALMLSRRTLRIIRQNLFWAFIYNMVGIPLAALGFLNPMIGALAMAFSSVSVVSNSLRLRTTRSL